MIAWIRRARQTRTQVDSPGAMQRERDAGLRLAFRVLGAMQLTTQLLLWTIQFGYDHLRQTTWQAAVFLTVPTLLLWLLWRRACRGGLEGGRRYWALLLLPNLCLDAYLCMLASNSLISDLIPAKTPLAWPLVVTFFPVVSSWLSRDKGAAYGAYTMRWLLAALVLCSTVFSGGDASLERLHPLLGDGLGKTLLFAAPGMGAVWGVALLELFPLRRGSPEPDRREKRRDWLFIAVPLLCCVLWALWLSMLEPWQPEESWDAGRKLAGLNQYGSNILIYGLGILFWMLMLPVSLLGTTTAGKLLLARAFPKIPKGLWPPALLLPGLALLAVSPSAILDGVPWILPLRYGLSLAAACALCLCRKRPGKETK